MFCIVPNITLSLDHISKMRAVLTYISIPIIWLLTATNPVPAADFSQTAQNGSREDSLYQKIMELDAQVFGAFNRRDSIGFAALFSKDLEFFHDKAGLTGYGETTGFLQSAIRNGSDLQRTFVPGTLEVYPIPGYGAIQTGTHEFCHTEQNKKDCGRFKFLHIWKQTGDHWQITRVISYDH